MLKSTKLHLIALLIAVVGFGVVAVPLWIAKDVPYAGALVLVGFALSAVGVLSGLGFGPLGHARNRASIDEDNAYRSSLAPKQPWQK